MRGARLDHLSWCIELDNSDHLSWRNHYCTSPVYQSRSRLGKGTTADFAQLPGISEPESLGNQRLLLFAWPPLLRTTISEFTKFSRPARLHSQSRCYRPESFLSHYSDRSRNRDYFRHRAACGKSLQEDL